jgi:hypothetical protein
MTVFKGARLVFAEAHQSPFSEYREPDRSRLSCRVL